MRHNWHPEEIKLLKELYPDNYSDCVAALLDKTIHQIYNRANELGLKKSKEFIQYELEIQGNRLRSVGQKTRYHENHIPLNKGKKMPKEVYEKAKWTMFKKGHLPHNTKYDGYERLSKDGYVEVRIARSKFIKKHQLIWEQHYGKIPKNMIVVFKDKNPLNLNIENLEMITKKENMLRNTIHRFPVELKQTIKLIHKVKKTIYAKEQN